jgi:hypothetical protein
LWITCRFGFSIRIGTGQYSPFLYTGNFSIQLLDCDERWDICDEALFSNATHELPKWLNKNTGLAKPEG